MFREQIKKIFIEPLHNSMKTRLTFEYAFRYPLPANIFIFFKHFAHQNSATVDNRHSIPIFHYRNKLNVKWMDSPRYDYEIPFTWNYTLLTHLADLITFSYLHSNAFMNKFEMYMYKWHQLVPIDFLSIKMKNSLVPNSLL